MPIYMKYEEIMGTGKGKYNGWIELESCQLRPETRSSSAANPMRVFVTKFLDNTTALILQESRNGKRKKVTIDFVALGESIPYMTIVMEDVSISSYQVSGGHIGDKPMESLSLNFAKISYNVTPTKPSNDPKHAEDKAAWNFAVQNSRFS